MPCWKFLKVPAPQEQEAPKHHDWRSLSDRLTDPKDFFCSIKILQDRRCFSWFWRCVSSEKMRVRFFFSGVLWCWIWMFFQNYSMWDFFENLNASSGQKGFGHLVRCSYMLSWWFQNLIDIRVCLATQAFHLPLHSSYHSVYASFPGLTDTKLKDCSASTWEGIVLNYKTTLTQGTHILYELASAQEGSNCRPSVQVISYLEHTKTTNFLRTTVSRCILFLISLGWVQMRNSFQVSLNMAKVPLLKHGKQQLYKWSCQVVRWKQTSNEECNQFMKGVTNIKWAGSQID